MSITLTCPHTKNGGQKDILACLYLCPKNRLIKCVAYLKVFPTLINFEINQKYIDKYGPVTIPVPASLRKRRKRVSKTEDD